MQCHMRAWITRIWHCLLHQTTQFCYGKQSCDSVPPIIQHRCVLPIGVPHMCHINNMNNFHEHGSKRCKPCWVFASENLDETGSSKGHFRTPVSSRSSQNSPRYRPQLSDRESLNVTPTLKHHTAIQHVPNYKGSMFKGSRNVVCHHTLALTSCAICWNSSTFEHK